jgi:hypothetical protein
MAMTSRAEIYERNAAECEQEAARAAMPSLKSKYRGIAQQWREMAQKAKRGAIVRWPKKKDSGP